jgi:hypothetical protein
MAQVTAPVVLASATMAVTAAAAAATATAAADSADDLFSFTQVEKKDAVAAMQEFRQMMMDQMEERMSAQIRLSMSSELEGMRARVTACEGDNKTLDGKVVVLQRDCDVLRTQCTALQQQCVAKELENGELVATVQRKDEQIVALVAKLGQEESKLQESMERLGMLRDEQDTHHRHTDELLRNQRDTHKATLAAWRAEHEVQSKAMDDEKKQTTHAINEWKTARELDSKAMEKLKLAREADSKAMDELKLAREAESKTMAQEKKDLTEALATATTNCLAAQGVLAAETKKCGLLTDMKTAADGLVDTMRDQRDLATGGLIAEQKLTAALGGTVSNINANLTKILRGGAFVVGVGDVIFVAVSVKTWSLLFVGALFGFAAVFVYCNAPALAGKFIARCAPAPLPAAAAAAVVAAHTP